MKYAIVIAPAGDKYCAHSPDVPGCAATGETPEELRRIFPATLHAHLQALLASGGEMPQPTTIAEMVDVEDVA